jgi:cell division protease FtsH
LVEKAYERSKKLIVKHRKELEELANLLLEKEVVVKDDLEKVFGKKYKKPSNPDKKKPSIDQKKYSI